MYQLYWAPDTGAMAPQVLLEEIGTPYEIVELDTEAGEEMKSDYLKINPRGQIPALVLPDGTVLTESAAIMIYLAEAHPAAQLLPEVGSSGRALAYRWLIFAVANLYESYLRFYYTDRFTDDISGVDAVKSAASQAIDQAWALLEDELKEGPYLLGNQYTVVDPYLLMLVYWHEDPDALLQRHPKLRLLCETTRGRSAVAKIWFQHYDL